MTEFNRGTGLLIIEARCSNPNGDPDQESEPRTISTDGRGMISPVSFKRKLRDLVVDKTSGAWQLWSSAQNWKSGPNGDEQSDISRPELSDWMLEGEEVQFGILETRFRDRLAIGKLRREPFQKAFWDGRVFGNTFLEALKEEGEDTAEDSIGSSPPKKKTAKKKTTSKAAAENKLAGLKEREHFISTGTVQFGLGVSIAPVEVERLTQTNKSGVQEGKDRGMAPLGFRVVQHGLYTMPFFVNPMMARKNGCVAKDIELLKFLIPHAYSQTASAIRPFVSVIHAWYAEHKSPLGSCPDPLIIDAMTPKKKGDPTEASKSLDDYEIPKLGDFPDELRARLSSFDDLCG